MYVNKEDENQVITPNHATNVIAFLETEFSAHFLSKVLYKIIIKLDDHSQWAHSADPFQTPAYFVSVRYIGIKV